MAPSWNLYLLSILMFTLRLGSGQAPQLVSQPFNITAYESTTLPCIASGTPVPTISWYRDGVLLDLSEDQLTMSPQGLVVSGLQESGGETLEGVYHCIATNTFGAIRSLPATLTRAVWSPGFTSTESSQMVVLRNSPLVLTCRPPQQSIPPATVTWDIVSPGGVALDGRLLLPAVQVLEVYTCTVSNPVASQTMESSRYTVSPMASINGENAVLLHDIEIVVPPVLQQTLVVGDTLTLECFISGNPLGDIVWTRSPSPLVMGGRVSTQQSASQLVITELEPADDGTYTCTVDPGNGRDSVTASGDVQVLVPPAIIASSFPETPPMASLDVSVSCSTESSSTPLTWVWFHNAQQLSPSSRVTYQTEGSNSVLTLSPSLESDRGVYQCVAYQAVTGRQAAYGQFIDITVVAPVFEERVYPDMLVLQDSVVTIPCHATGFPPPTFTWATDHGNGQTTPIEIDERRSLPPAGTGDGSLTISSVAIDDSSTLICSASNSHNIDPVQAQSRLLVIAMPVLTPPPESLIPAAGTSVSLTCSAQPSDSGGYTLQYRWTRGHDGALVGADLRDEGTLTLTSIQEDQSDNDVYTCIAVLTKDGYVAQPLIITVGSTTLTVGEPPSPPDSATDVIVTDVTANSFTVNWVAPGNNGGLPILSYSVEIRHMGSSFCPVPNPEWEVARSGIERSVSSWTIEDDVYADMQYQFRVIVFTSMFSTVSTTSPPFTTAQTVPRDPPVDLHIVLVTETALTLSWNTPTLCTYYGGGLLGYSVQYQVEGGAVFTNSTTVTQYTLTSLTPGSTYHIKVAARNERGVGPYTDDVTETTDFVSPLPPAPNLTHVANNHTSITLTWVTPPTDIDILNFIISYVRPDGTSNEIIVETNTTSSTLIGLSPGTYNFTLTVVYEGGRGSVATVLVTVPNVQDSGLLGEVWFYAAMATAVVVLVGLICILIACICCQLRRKASFKVGGKHGNGAPVRTASNHFSEYKRKDKNTSNIMPHVVVHTSPTPSRRSTDYAVPTLHTTHHIPASTGPPSTGPPSSAHPSTVNSSATSTPQFSTRNTFCGHSNGTQQNRKPHHLQNGNLLSLQNGNVPMDHFEPYRDMTPSIQEFSFEDNNLSPEYQTVGVANAEHIRQLSASTSHKFVDTLSRVHTPPPPTKYPSREPPLTFSSSYLARTSSQDIEEPPFNPGEMVNARGHMTNNPVGRGDSFRSTESSNSMEFQGASQLAGEYRQPLSPLHEAHLMGGRSHDFQEGSHDDGKSYLTEVDEIRMSGRREEREEIDMPLEGLVMQGSPLLDEYGRGPTGDGRLAGFEPPVHVSHSRNIYQPSSPPSPTLSDLGYAVPPRLVPRQVSQEQEVVYQHPPPAYAAPPPPPSGPLSHPSPSPPPPSSRGTTKGLLGPSTRGLTGPSTGGLTGPSTGGLTGPSMRGSFAKGLIGPSMRGPSAGDLPGSSTRGLTSLPTRSPHHVTHSLTGPPLHTSRDLASPPPHIMKDHSRNLKVIGEKRLNVKPLGPPQQPPNPHPPNTSQPPNPRPPNTSQPPNMRPPNTNDAGMRGRSISMGPIPPALGHSMGPIPPALGHSMETVPPALGHSRETVPPGPGMHGRSVSMGSGGFAQRHERSSSIESRTSQSEVRILQVIPMDGGLKHHLPSSTEHSTSSLHNSIDDSIGSGWSLDRIQRSMEQKASNFDNMLSPLQEHGDGSLGHMTNGHTAPIPTKPPKPPTLPKPQAPPKHVPKPHQRMAMASSPPPDIIPHDYSSDEDHTSIAINKKRPKVPDLTTIDPRKPTLKVKKVPRSVWQPRPMTRAIQSSSSESESDGSDLSVDTVVVRGRGDTSTLRSAHV